MKKLLEYRLASIKEGRFYFMTFLILAFLFVVWIFAYFITRGVASSEYSLRSTSLFKESPFFSACHNTLLATLPTLSFALGTGLGYLFVSSDYERRRLKMIFGAYLDKRRFYLSAVFASNLIGVSLILVYWLLFSILSFPILAISAVEGSVLNSVLITLLCSLILFWFSLFLSGFVGVLCKKGAFAGIFCISLYLVAVFYAMISLSVTPPKETDSLSYEIGAIEKNPLAGLVLLNRYGNVSVLWDHLAIGLLASLVLFLVGMFVYEKKEV